MIFFKKLSSQILDLTLCYILCWTLLKHSVLLLLFYYEHVQNKYSKFVLSYFHASKTFVGTFSQVLDNFSNFLHLFQDFFNFFKILAFGAWVHFLDAPFGSIHVIKQYIYPLLVVFFYFWFSSPFILREGFQPHYFFSIYI